MAFNKSLAGYFDDLAHVGIPTDDLPKTIAFWEKLGFKKQGQFDTDDQGHQVVFMKYGHLMLEIWDSDGAFKAAKEEGFNVKEDEVQHLDFWKHGIKFFNIVGPNDETVEFCEVVKG